MKEFGRGARPWRPLGSTNGVNDAIEISLFFSSVNARESTV